MKLNGHNGISSADLHRPTNYAINYRIRGTKTSLTINVRPTVIIQPADMARTIIQTQLRLRRYITTHYHAEEDVLFPRDDPYVSEERFTGCFLVVGSWPNKRQARLTYGMLNNTLTGIFDVLYRRERFVGADFWVYDDDIGRVGVGRVDIQRPDTRYLRPHVFSRS